MHRISNTLLLLITCIILFTSCNNSKKNSVVWASKDGYVPNETSAIKIAEMIWLNIYGSNIEDEKPFKAHLKDGKVWVVTGTLKKYELGGVAYIEIQKSDCKILKVIHGK